MNTIQIQAVSTALNAKGAVRGASTLRGIARQVAREVGEGWGYRVSGPKAALVELGAYEAAGGTWLLDLKNGQDPILVYPTVETSKKGKLHRDNFSSLLQWESAVSAVYGGVFSQWPEWAQDVLRRERGYVG